jgi:hypothetical protein
MELTLLRMLDTTPGTDVTRGRAEAVTALTPPATLETRPWTDDPTDGSRDVAELTLLRTLVKRLPIGSTLGRLMLEIVFRSLGRLDKRPWIELSLARPMLET